MLSKSLLEVADALGDNPASGARLALPAPESLAGALIVLLELPPLVAPVESRAATMALVAGAASGMARSEPNRPCVSPSGPALK